MIKHKLNAATLHLLISAIVVGCFIAFTLLIWYPAPFMHISGLKDIVLILITIDLVLGPLLTFAIFKPHKPHLKFDLAMIGTVQLAALGYGMFTIYQGHPVYVAYAVDRFTLITAQEARPEQAKYPELNVSTLWKPTLVYAQKPTDPKVLEALMFDTLSGKPDLDARPEYYEPFDKFAQTVFANGVTPEALAAKPEHQQKLDKFLAKHGKTAADYAFLPLVGKEYDVLWAWDRATGKPVGTLDINPWQAATVAAAK